MSGIKYTAVILAAGLGSRLKDRTTYIPKGFIEIENESLIERSIRLLLAAGINEIIIGTGHGASYYNALSDKYPQIKCKYSELYATTGSMYTFYNMRDILDQPILLLESDLLYHPSGLSALLEHPCQDVILASGTTNSGDEVYIETDEENRLMNMSKNKSELSRINAELVGITKLSVDAYHRMFSYTASVLDTLPRLDYEHAMVAVSDNQHPILVHKLEAYPWCEIDDEQHLKRALEKIWPQIKSGS